jgi:hypothetical protein
MSFLGPKILKVNGGLGQQAPSDRNVAGLIIANGYEVSTTFVFGQVYKLNSLDDAEALGLSAATDANAAADTVALTWYHISEFFRLNPDGTLYVFNGEAIAVANIFAAAGPADALMAASSNGIRFMGVVFGFDPDATLTITGGFASFVPTAIAAAQTWVTARAEAHVFVDCVIIEGVSASTTTVDLKALDSPQVLVTVACDHGYLADYDAAFLKSAAVGTTLGSIGVRKLSESIGSVVLQRYPSERRGSANYSLVDTRRNRWVKTGLSTGVLFDDMTQAVRTDLTTKAYCYAGSYEGYPGIYFNGEATCTLTTDDFNTIHANRVWNETARGIRRALIPRMNSVVRIDPATGQIAPATIADWDAAAKREIDVLVAEEEVADYTFRLDPAQDVIAQGKVVTRIRVVPNGIAKAIEAEIGFTNPAQA